MSDAPTRWSHAQLDRLAQHHVRLRRLAAVLVRDEHGADDLAQDAWVRALERGPEGSEALGSWLATVVRRLASNGRRAGGRRRAREVEAARPEAVPSSADIAARVEVEARLRAALDALDEPHRSLLRDRYLGDLGPREIAARDGLSEEAVKSRLRRARAAFRSALEREGLGPDADGRTAHWTAVVAPLLAWPGAAPPPLMPPSAPLPPVAAGATLLLGTLVAMKKVAVIAVAALAAVAVWNVRDLGPPEPARTKPLERRSQSADLDAPRATETRESSAAAPVAGADRSPAPTAGTDATGEASIALGGHFRYRDGEGVPGVRFALVMHRGSTLEGDELHRIELVTDESGAFAYALAPQPMSVAFDIDVEDDPTRDFLVYAPRHVVLGETEVEPFDVLVFDFDATLEGVVRGPSGEAVAGADVWGMRARTRTHSDGTFSMTVAGRAWGRIYASADGYGLVEHSRGQIEPGEVGHVELVLPLGATVAGTVRDDLGHPLEGLVVKTSGRGLDPVRTDAAGRYAIERIPLDERRSVNVSVTAAEYTSATEEVEFEPGRTEYEANFVVGRGVSVRGVVLDPDGAPLPGAEVWIGAWDNRTARTDDEGRFAFDGVRPGRTKLGATRRGFADALEEREIVGGETLELRMVRPIVIRGRVLDSAGQPITAGVTLAARTEGAYVGQRGRVDSDGRFEVPGVPPGVALEIEAFGKGWVRSTVHVPAGRTDGVELVLTPAGVLRGRAVDAATGAPIRNFTVRIDWPSVDVDGPQIAGIESKWFKPGRSFENDAGRWSTDEYDEVTPGSWAALEVSAPGYATLRHEAVPVVTIDDESEVLHELVPPIDVEVSLQSAPGGEPVAGARVIAARSATPSDERAWEAVSGAAGSALLEDVSPGPLHVRVVRSERADVVAGPFEVGPGAAPIVVDVPVGRTVEVALENAKGDRVAGATISMFTLEAGTTQGTVTATTDASGLARFEGVAPGTWRAGVSVGDGRGGDQDLARSFRVPAEGAVAPVVLGPEGRAVLVCTFRSDLRVPDGTVLRLLGSDGSAVRAGTTSGGAFSLEGVAAGTYTLSGYFYAKNVGRSVQIEHSVIVEQGVALIEEEIEIEDPLR